RGGAMSGAARLRKDARAAGRSPWLRREVPAPELPAAVHGALEREGWRFGHQTARQSADGSLRVEALLLDPARGAGEILSAPLTADATAYPSVTARVPAAHWAERAIGDFFGLRAEGHPRWKNLLLHEPWPPGLAPLRE